MSEKIAKTPEYNPGSDADKVRYSDGSINLTRSKDGERVTSCHKYFTNPLASPSTTLALKGVKNDEEIILFFSGNRGVTSRDGQVNLDEVIDFNDYPEYSAELSQEFEAERKVGQPGFGFDKILGVSVLYKIDANHQMSVSKGHDRPNPLVAIKDALAQ